MARLIPASALALALLGGLASAKPLSYVLPGETAALKPAQGPGFEATQNNCMSCHSADYISTQPPKRGAAFWEAETTKMIKVYHAPIDAADIELINAYLAQTY